MSLTAFLPTGAPQILPFIGTPGAATVGHALVWSQTPQGFTLSPITVGPDQFSGVLPVSKGGWGTNTGSFTSPGAISLTAGGTNQDINLNPSGTGKVIIPNRLQFALAPNTNNITGGFEVAKQGGFLQVSNGVAAAEQFVPQIFGKSVNADRPGLIFGALPFRDSVAPPEGLLLFGTYNTSYLSHPANWLATRFTNGSIPLLSIFGSGDSIFHSTTESTSTTTGALQIAGGLGVAKSLYAAGGAGSKVNFANLPTASTGLNPGDLWRDSNGFLRIV